MDIEKRELWERLANEPERAYRAFERFLTLASGERSSKPTGATLGMQKS
jgi:hypothetical protein